MLSPLEKLQVFEQFLVRFGWSRCPKEKSSHKIMLLNDVRVATVCFIESHLWFIIRSMPWVQTKILLGNMLSFYLQNQNASEEKKSVRQSCFVQEICQLNSFYCFDVPWYQSHCSWYII
jgi:hypothetical protein